MAVLNDRHLVKFEDDDDPILRLHKDAIHLIAKACGRHRLIIQHWMHGWLVFSYKDGKELYFSYDLDKALAWLEAYTKGHEDQQEEQEHATASISGSDDP